MNFLLYINRKIINNIFNNIYLFSFILFKQFSLYENSINKSNTKLSKIDIEEPKFAINNDTKKIKITAKEETS